MVFQGAKTVTIRLIFRMIPSEILSELNFRVDFWIQNSQFLFFRSTIRTRLMAVKIV